jgi:hypothetical protein
MQAVSVGELNGLPIEEQLAGARQNAKSAELNDRIATRAYRVLGGARWIPTEHRLVRELSGDRYFLHDACLHLSLA